MAGPSVVVRFLADLTGLNKAATETAGAIQGMAQKGASAFHGMVGVLNQTGVLGEFGGALDGVGKALDTVAEHGKKIGPVMMGVGAGVAGIGTALAAMGSKDAAAHQQLQAAVEATGRSYDDYGGQVDKAIKHQEHFGHTANETQDALRIMTQGMGDPQKALDRMGEAADLAAAKHESLSQAATQLTRTYNGANKLLKEFGVETLPKASAATKALEMATKAADTSDTAAAKAKQNLADLQARLGVTQQVATVSTAGMTAAQTRLALAQQHLGDVQTALAGKTTLTQAEQIRLRNAQQSVFLATQSVTTAHDNYGAALEKANGKAGLSIAQQQQLRNATQAVTDTTAKATDAHAKLATAHDAAAKAAGNQGRTLDELGAKLKGQASAQADTFRGKLDALKASVEDAAAKFGQKYGPAITAAGAAMTGLGATIELVTALHIGSVIGWLADAAAALAAAVAENIALLGIPILIAAVVAGIAWMIFHWHQVKDAVMDVWNWIVANWPLLLSILTGPFGLAIYMIVSHWNDLMGFFRGVVGDVERIFADVWGGITTAFKDVINGVIDVWNALHFTLPKVDILGVHIGGESIGVPTIPHMAAGGIVTAPTLALLGERGPEAVVPLGRGMGPAVHIDNVNLHDGADVELLLTKIRFATLAGKL